MIRGRVVARAVDQGVNRERKRIVAWGRRFVCSASGDAEGVAMRNRQKDDFTIAPPMRVVKRFASRPCVSMRALFAWAVDNCRMRLADCAVKAVSRAAARAEQSEAP